MFNKKEFDKVLVEYKKVFMTDEWREEEYKWAAVKHFQEHWNIDASDFKSMFIESMSKTDNLLKAKNFLPLDILKEMIDEHGDLVKTMFRELYDESIDLSTRIDNFMKMAREKVEKGKNTFQSTNSISTYLWLKYPDKYYIYKYSEVKKVSEILQSDFIPRRDGKPDTAIKAKEMYDLIAQYLREDEELQAMKKEFLSEDSYPDPESRTLAIDFGYFISREYIKEIPGDTDEVDGDKPNNDEVNEDTQKEIYTKERFLNEVYLSSERYDELKELLENKKNIILQGAPGVGKTYMAKRLAYSILGEKDDEKIEFIQFHQNYSYEDFMMGYKPEGDSFELQYGIFYNFCDKAKKDKGSKYFLIIDEINRGNLSKIFGELLMLIEEDKRGDEATLAYSKKKFSVPQNLYIIGMMNTADRSIALIDYALRRRFSFFDIEPAFQSDGFIKYQEGLNNNIFNNLIKIVEQLNSEIETDASLGKGFCIGHSYFSEQEDIDDMKIGLIVKYDILPQLKEYFFDDEEKYNRWRTNLLGVLNERE